MPNSNQLKFPPKLRAIVADEGSYEDDTFAPLLINVSELGHKGRTVIGYQLILKAGEHYEEIEDLMYDAGLQINGQGWEVLARKFLKSKDATFEKLVEGDTEGTNCVLWTDKEDSFRRLLDYILALVADSNWVKGAF
jgi:hypothetical protein